MCGSDLGTAQSLFVLCFFLGAKAPLELVRLSGWVSKEKVSKQQDLLDLIEEL